MKTRFIIYNIVTHTVFLVIIIFFYNKFPVLFVISELILIISLGFSIHTAIKLFRPYRLMDAGIASLKDKDFTTKFNNVGQPELDNLIDVYNNMIDQLRLERTKQYEKQFFLEKLVKASPAGIIIFTIDGKIKTINNAAKRIISEDFIATGRLKGIWKKCIEELNYNESIIIRLNSINQYRCQKSHLMDRGVKIPFVIIEELTEEIIKTEKRAYGKVIRMMAHEVNNTLGAVNSIINSSISYLKKINSEKHINFIHALKVSSERNKSLNIFMKNFADIIRLPKPNKHKVNINESLTGSFMFIKMSCENKEIEFVNNINSGEFNIYVDQEQMEHVFINILKNAVEAIEEKGTIIIETIPDKKQIIISNTGEPISFETGQRLFEAFFTTKKNGQGIGLTLIKEILKNHSCDFSLKTRSSGITEFKIVFKYPLKKAN